MITPEGKPVRTTRRSQNLTIVELSKITGLPQATISKYERGLMKLPIETVELLKSSIVDYNKS